MKKKIYQISATLLILFMGMLVFFACEEKEENFPRTRLFSPVLNEDLLSEENTIIVNMGKMKEAESYTLLVSRDTFKTTDYTIEVDTNYVVINSNLIGEELLWFTLYQVRAIAHADDPQYDSKVSDLGSVRTQKFPSNMGTPTSFDILDTQARVFWTTAGAPITGIKVFAATDLRLQSPLLQFTVTEADQAAAQKYIAGLSPSTKYQIAIYSENTVRGWEIYSTRAGLVSGDKVYNLSGIAKTTILADTLADVPNGSTILLEGGRTYTTGGYKFDKSIKIMAGYSFVQALPLIDCTANFHVLGGSTVDSIVFKDIAFKGSFSANYVFNPSETAAITVGEIRFESCTMRSLRGIARFRGPAPGNIAKFTITDCVVDSIADYAVFTLDTDNGITVGDILLKNSTFSKCRYFLVSRTQSQSVTIEDCTISEAPETGAIMFRWRGATGTDNITNGLTIKNTIWSNAWDKSSTGGFAVKADNGGTSLDQTTINIVNVYSTSKFAFTAGFELAGFPVGNYTGTAEDLWVSPLTGMNFNFKDSGFAGKKDCGDPRWRSL